MSICLVIIVVYLLIRKGLCCKHILFLEGSSDNRKGLQFSLLAKRGHLKLSDCCSGAPEKACG